MTLDCTKTIGAACAEAFELFLQAAPKVTPVSTDREIPNFDMNLDGIENILLQSTIDPKWQMQHATDLLFFITFSIFLLLITLHYLVRNFDVRDHFPVPRGAILEGYLIIQAWALNVKAGTTLALLFSLRHLYKFVTTRREQEDPDPEEEFPHEVFENLIQNFWRPILVGLIFANLYERYAKSFFNATNSEHPFRDFFRIVLWGNDGNETWLGFCLSFCELLIGILEILYLCPDPNTIVGEALRTFVEDAWEEIEERTTRYVDAIRRIIDRLRGVEATDEVVRRGERPRAFQEVGFHNLPADDLEGFGHCIVQ